MEYLGAELAIDLPEAGGRFTAARHGRAHSNWVVAMRNAAGIRAPNIAMVITWRHRQIEPIVEISTDVAGGLINRSDIQRRPGAVAAGKPIELNFPRLRKFAGQQLCAAAPRACGSGSFAMPLRTGPPSWKPQRRSPNRRRSGNPLHHASTSLIGEVTADTRLSAATSRAPRL